MFPVIQDTIIALSTPPGRSFHAVIKISGFEAIHSIKDLFIPGNDIDLEAIPTYISIRGYIHLEKESIGIPVTLYIMKQPHSYTREDVVEIHTFSSPPLVEMLLDGILSKGIQSKRSIRFSQPGEFTKRAFLHGRIDLTQAEAVMRIIHAQSDRELETAVAQLSGAISLRMKHIQDEIISLCSYVEAALDFSDQDIELISAGEIMDRLKAVEKDISHLLVQSETGKASLEGIHTVFFGSPNVGKSSIMNVLLGRRRSIVSEISGTTRDVVADVLEMNGIRFRLIDTAGVDDTKHIPVPLEQRDIVIPGSLEKTQSVLKNAHIVLLVLDSNIDLSKQLEKIRVDDLSDNVVIVMNKCDLQKKHFPPLLPVELKKYPVVYTSALTGEGLERLKDILVKKVLGGLVDISGNSPIFHVRQKDALQRSLKSIQQAIESVRANEGYEFIALEMRTALDTLGEIVGEVTTEDILDKIFSAFCIGK